MIRTFGVSRNTLPMLQSVPAGSTIINTDATYRIWVSSDPGVTTNNGFPLEPLSSMSKPKDGPLYACLDSSAPSTYVATMLVGDDLTGYENPEALAAATAAALVSSGIPNVIQWTQLFAGTIAGGGQKSIDVSKYGTVVINTLSTSAFASFIDPNGNFVDEAMLLPGPSQLFSELRVTAPTLLVTNPDASAKQFYISGTNRLPDQRYTSGYSNEVVEVLQANNVTVGNNTTVFLSSTGTLCSLQGMCYAYFRVNPGTVLGYFQINSMDGNTMVLAETSDPAFHTSPRGGNAANMMIALPPWGDALANGISFHCSSGGTSGVNFEVRLVQVSQ